MRLPQASCQSLGIFLRGVILLSVALAALTSEHAAAQQLSSSISALHFGTVPLGQSESQFMTLTNNGTTSVTLSGASANVSGFSVSGLNLPATIGAGQTLGFNVKFSPSGLGWIGGRITFSSTASDPSLAVQIGGTGVSSDSLTASPAAVSFGNVTVGSSASTTIVLTNARSSKETLTSFQTVGNAFTISAPSLPLVLNPGQSVSAKITFAPQALGEVGGSIFINLGLNIPLTGIGMSGGVQLGVSPSSLNFGNVLIGESGTGTLTLTASGGNVTISSMSSSSSQFSASGISLPVTIKSGQSVTLGVEFTPKSAGAASGTLSFSSNAGDSSLSESLTGTGETPQISLNWNASTSSEVSGYNVYRSTSSGGSFAKVNTTLDATTEFTDGTVSAGQTYYYVTTAVNSKGEESGYSNEVAVSVP